jgi:dGTP triphosphohydrolase
MFSSSQNIPTIGRLLMLNEDLIEAVSLGHDIGMPLLDMW